MLPSSPYLSRVSARDAKPPQGGFCISRAIVNLRMVVVRPRARVYVDGFNFDYAAFGRGRGTHAAYRWLDLPRFFDVVLPDLDITHIRYFTAKVRPAPWKPADYAATGRQERYLGAIASSPRTTIHQAKFATWRVKRPLAGPIGVTPTYVTVWDTKEKGSDVSLASFMLVDGFKGLCDVAVVVSDDSDLLDPVRLVRSELGLTVGVVRVSTHRASVFRADADFVRSVRRWHFATSQLPDVVDVPGGSIRRPEGW